MDEIKWVAQFNGKDEEDREVIKVGIRQERHLVRIYFDFDTDDGEGVAESVSKAMAQIENRWGYWDTFKWIRN